MEMLVLSARCLVVFPCLAACFLGRWLPAILVAQPMTRRGDVSTNRWQDWMVPSSCRSSSVLQPFRDFFFGAVDGPSKMPVKGARTHLVGSVIFVDARLFVSSAQHNTAQYSTVNLTCPTRIG